MDHTNKNPSPFPSPSSPPSLTPRHIPDDERGLNDKQSFPVEGPPQPQCQPPLIPPHWSHKRHESYLSLDDGRPPHLPITLEDNTGDQSERSSSCWARAVSIDDYVLISGSIPSVGTFVVFNCKVDTLDVSLPRCRGWRDGGVIVLA